MMQLISFVCRNCLFAYIEGDHICSKNRAGETNNTSYIVYLEEVGWTTGKPSLYNLICDGICDVVLKIKNRDMVKHYRGLHVQQ